MSTNIQSPSKLNRSLEDEHKDYEFAANSRRLNDSRVSGRKSENQDFDFNQSVNHNEEEYGGNEYSNRQEQQINEDPNNAYANNNNNDQSRLSPSPPGRKGMMKPMTTEEERKSLLKPSNQAGQQDQGNKEVIKWRNINIFLTMLNVFLTIIFLQVLAFAQNAVPQTNNITIAKGVSIAYFALSIFTLILMYLQFQFVNYGYKNIIACWRVFSAIYGLIIVVLGVLVLAIDISKSGDKANASWMTMSNNQKLYFSYDVSQLQKERKKNDALVGAFAIVIGLITMITAFPLHMLYNEMALKWKPAMNSRLPEVEPHEQVDFVFKCIRDDDDLHQDHNFMPGAYQDQVKISEEDVSNFNGDDERDEQFLVQKDQQMAENQMQMQFGAIPGQGAYDPYANEGQLNRGYGTNYNSGSPQRYY